MEANNAHTQQQHPRGLGARLYHRLRNLVATPSSSPAQQPRGPQDGNSTSRRARLRYLWQAATAQRVEDLPTRQSTHTADDPAYARNLTRHAPRIHRQMFREASAEAARHRQQPAPIEQLTQLPRDQVGALLLDTERFRVDTMNRLRRSQRSAQVGAQDNPSPQSDLAALESMTLRDLVDLFIELEDQRVSGGNDEFDDNRIETIDDIRAAAEPNSIAQRKLDQLNDNDCGICKDEYTSPVTTTCGHVFCKKCALRHTQRHKDCPFCRGAHRADQLTTIKGK